MALASRRKSSCGCASPSPLLSARRTLNARPQRVYVLAFDKHTDAITAVESDLEVQNGIWIQHGVDANSQPHRHRHMKESNDASKVLTPMRV